MIKNPVLSGFHPDPCMINVDGTFYIANSTFEYFPGVKISKSKDLANWETVGYPLNEKLLDMKGNIPEGGIWAPCLTYHDNKYYLVFTDVKSCDIEPFKDTPNYITTAKTIDGEWSEPVYVNSSGFDPSLFHDDDGRKYFVNMEWDYRQPTGTKQFSGILLTELDPVTLKPISETKKIFLGTDRGILEGPHIYKLFGYYYLFCAEGGTSYAHAVTVARSKNIYGPYEVHPQKHLIDAFKSDNYLQKTGHGSICQGPDGRWWLAFLCGRPIDDSLRCPLGRETGIAEIIWKDDWPYLKNGGTLVPTEFEGYGEKIEKKVFDYDFNSKEFKNDFMSLRVPAKYDVLDNGSLRLYGEESPLSRHTQNILIRRQQDFYFQAETCVTLPANHFQKMAGLIYRYSEENQYYLRFSYDERKGCKTLGILTFDKYNFIRPLGDNEIEIHSDTVYLRLTVEGRYGKFSYSLDGKKFIDIDYKVDSSILSDEYATPMGFTGSFVGMCCQDICDKTAYADFSYFKYTKLD